MENSNSRLRDIANIDYAEALERMQLVAERHRAYLQEIGRLVRHKSVARKSGIGNCTEKNVSAPTEAFHLEREPSKRGPQRPSLSSIYSRSKSYDQNLVTLHRAIGHQCAKTISAPHSTPRHDSSVIDGFVLSSRLTKNASPTNPLILKLISTAKAANSLETEPDINTDDELEHLDEGCSEVDQPRCVEITAGARLPVNLYPEMDAVVGYADVQELSKLETGNGRMRRATRTITITKPVESRQNRRLAGSDVQRGTVIIAQGETVQPRHIMALASLRCAEIPILDNVKNVDSDASRLDGSEKLSVAVLSIGSELTEVSEDARRIRSFASTSDPDCSPTSRIPNANGPYLLGSIKACGLDVHSTYLGIATDERRILAEKLRRATEPGTHDVVVASGGMSATGRLDLMREVVEKDLGAEIIVHGVTIKPGKPFLMALIPNKSGTHAGHSLGGNGAKTPGFSILFALPENPLDVAATFHCLVLPYLDSLRPDASPAVDEDPATSDRTPEEGPGSTEALSPWSTTTFPHDQEKLLDCKPNQLTVFWLGKRLEENDMDDANPVTVKVLEDQASYKVGSLLQADCWVLATSDTGAISKSDIVAMIDF